MSRIPYRALMRPQRTPPVARPGSPVVLPAPPAAPKVAVEAVEVEEAAVVEPPVAPAPVAEPVAEHAVEEAVEEAVEPAVEEPVVEPVVEPVEAVVTEPVAPVATASAAPKVNSASSKTDLLAAAAALGLTSVSATNTRAELWVAVQAANTP